MSHSDWMIYGATGYTGVLVAEEALRRGHRPLLAGRNAEKLAALAGRLGLAYRAIDINDRVGLRAGLRGLRAVIHCAGPFIDTADQMRAACLDEQVHYLDITGEREVFETGFDLDGAAKRAGVALISGLGFDVVPTDCLIAYVCERLPGAQSLDVAFSGSTVPSAGTARVALNMLAKGAAALERRDGRLQAAARPAAQWFDFPRSRRYAVQASWGDLSTGYVTSGGVPNIRTFMGMPPRLGRWIGLGRALGRTLAFPPLYRLAEGIVERRFKGPDADALAAEIVQVLVEARHADGRRFRAGLITPEAYRLTAESSVLALERVIASDLSGALTPALAFGADFVLQIGGVERIDLTSDE